jgi:hypothetical protein
MSTNNPDLDDTPLPAGTEDTQFAVFHLPVTLNTGTGETQPVDGSFAVRITPADTRNDTL